MDRDRLFSGPSLGWVIDRFDYTIMFATAATLIAVGTAGFALGDRGRR
jgi:hypothetical protein